MQTHDLELPDCAGGESFALMVMGHSMAPEFLEGEIIIIEPEGLAKDGGKQRDHGRFIAGAVRPGVIGLILHDSSITP